MSETLRMNAYYYSFEPTGAHPIDRVLSAVAEAGKSYHNTSEWTDGTDWLGNPQAPHPAFGGASCAEWIQNAANDAATALAAATARADREAAARQEAERDRDTANAMARFLTQRAADAEVLLRDSRAELTTLRAELAALRG